jgi:DNA-binding response OmpR family regulator
MTAVLKLLWLDDDSPATTRRFGDVEVTCVQTCNAAASYLETATPSFVVVDLVVPQGGWRNDELLGLPGLAFAEHIIATSGAESPDVVIFSACVSDTLRTVARDIGVAAVYDKMSIPFAELLDRLVRRAPRTRRS